MTPNPVATSSHRPLWQRALLTYVGLFGFSGVAFGAIQGAIRHSVSHGVVAGLVFGIIMSATLGTMTVVGQRGNTGSWSPRRRLTLDVPADESTVRKQVHAALAQVRARITHDDPVRICARTRVTWKTWGTRIDVDITADAHSTRVTVKVRPRVPTTLIDYGAAHRIVQIISHYLTPVNGTS